MSETQLPFIIMSAPNGARRQKSDHSEIPITPEEMAICAAQIAKEGTSIIHLHVRDEQNKHSLDPDRYRASISAIKKAVGNDLIIQSTTEAVGIYSREEQMTIVKELKPEAVSLALRELCPTDDTLNEFSEFINWINSEHIFPQYILYDKNDYDRFETYRKKGIFQNDNPFTLFVFGSYQGQTPDTIKKTNELKKTSLTARFPWAACGFDINEKECITHAVKNNGHIRVGFENNLWSDENVMLENNAEMVKYASIKAESNQRTIASANDVRNMFNLRD